MNTKVAQRIIQRRFLVGGLFALTDNQSASDIKFASRELLWISTRNNHRARRNVALICYRFIACYVYNMSLAGNYGIRADNRLATNVCALDDNSTRANKAVVLDNYGGSLHRL